MIRPMTIDDYSEVYKLWQGTPGVGLFNLDDSREGIDRFLRANPTTSFVAVYDGCIVGVMLGGHDGRRGFIYHACVHKDYRHRSIGRQLFEHVKRSMQTEKINRLALVAFKDNSLAEAFWKEMGWEERQDLNYYTFSLNENN